MVKFQQVSNFIGKSVAPTVVLGLVNLCTACSMPGQNVTEMPVEAAPVTAVVALGRIEPEGEVILPRKRAINTC